MNNVREGFESRAKEFLEDIAQKQGFTIMHRESGHDVKELKVGIGRHAGLVFKDGAVSHAREAERIYDTLLAHFQDRGYGSYSYELVKPNFVSAGEMEGIVQEYFAEPSMSELIGYLTMKKEIKKRGRKLQRELNPKELATFNGRYTKDESSRTRCEEFLNKTGITLEQMTEVLREFTCDADYLRLSIKSDNVIVLGQRGEGLERIGLAIIDY